MEITKKQTACMATAKKTAGEYNINFSYENGEILEVVANVMAEIPAKIVDMTGVESDVMQNQNVGHLHYKDGKIELSLNQEADISVIVTEFKEIVEEIENIIKQESKSE